MAFGIADPVLGEDVAAMVVPADEKITEADLRMYLLDRLIQFKVPAKSTLLMRYQKHRPENKKAYRHKAVFLNNALFAISRLLLIGYYNDPKRSGDQSYSPPCTEINQTY